MLSNTQIQATLVTLTRSFQDIYFHWSQIQPVYIWNIVVQYMYSSHTYLLSELASCIGQSKKSMYIVASEKTGRSIKARSFWLEVVWLIQLASSDQGSPYQAVTGKIYHFKRQF